MQKSLCTIFDSVQPSERVTDMIVKRKSILQTSLKIETFHEKCWGSFSDRLGRYVSILTKEIPLHFPA